MDSRLEPRCLLRWTFLRGDQLITCLVDRRRRDFRVSLVPLSPAGSAATTRFPTLFTALQRHAAITARLREQGWIVVRYSHGALRAPHRARGKRIAA